MGVSEGIAVLVWKIGF